MRQRKHKKKTKNNSPGKKEVLCSILTYWESLNVAHGRAHWIGVRRAVRKRPLLCQLALSVTSMCLLPHRFRIRLGLFFCAIWIKRYATDLMSLAPNNNCKRENRFPIDNKHCCIHAMTHTDQHFFFFYYFRFALNCSSLCRSCATDNFCNALVLFSSFSIWCKLWMSNECTWAHLRRTSVSPLNMCMLYFSHAVNATMWHNVRSPDNSILSERQWNDDCLGWRFSHWTFLWKCVCFVRAQTKK